jgi:hypothetical protein
MEDSNITEPTEQPDPNSDEGILLKALNMRYSKKDKIIVADLESFKTELEKIKSNKQELLSIENDLLGLKVAGISHSLTFQQLQNNIHDSLRFVMKEMPTRIPLGVN